MNWLRYGRLRPFVVRFTGHLPGGWLRRKLLDFLYPLDARIKFK